MLVKKEFAKSTFVVVIVTLIFISPIFSSRLSSMFSSSGSFGPIYDVATAEETQQNIRKLCEEQDISYELLLSINHIDKINSRAIQGVEEDLSELIYLRNYWADKGYADEHVFDLMIISRDMGIESCKDYVKENPHYKDNEYLKSVSEYKFHLEQNLDFI